MNPAPMATPLLIFSVIIPTRNRPERLARCLAALAQSSFNTECFEIIIVDDGSDMPLDPTIAPFTASLNIHLHRQPPSGPAAARNTGVKHAQAPWLAFTDDDCQPRPDWLEQLRLASQTHPAALLGGQTSNGLPRRFFSTASQNLIAYLYHYHNPDPLHARFFASNNFAMPANLCRQIGCFDPDFPLAAAEDRDLCDRWLAAGFDMVYVPQAIVQHLHPLSFSSFFRQHYNYGRGARCFQLRKTARSHTSVPIEPLSFYLRLLTFPFTTHAPLHAALLACCLLLSQLANALGYFREMLRSASTPPRQSDP